MIVIVVVLALLPAIETKETKQNGKCVIMIDDMAFP